MSQITFSTQNQIEMEPEYTNITTFQNDTTSKPFMFAIWLDNQAG